MADLIDIDDDQRRNGPCILYDASWAVWSERQARAQKVQLVRTVEQINRQTDGLVCYVKRKDLFGDLSIYPWARSIRELVPSSVLAPHQPLEHFKGKEIHCSVTW
ncbi:hypothetical protein LOAG_10805 [Loa loa]|uniref:Uncharacterized protein n=1 Tax=Loa loa TaxID=7209 RepID=A0A1S0TPQ2_LOALO|nr:hypothetical protein LOAG_10805 [Loa loa]EFO17690.1 hypothetical protein LOAG_10805 [Loa loa]